MSDYIVDQPDKIAFRDELGHDIAWDSFDYGDAPEEQKAAFESAYEIVKNGHDSWFHTDGDLYQGSTLMRVIRRKADGRLFGFKYWEGGGKHGETDMVSNGDDHGFETKYDEDCNTVTEWFVFLPVISAPIPAFKFAGDDE